jgi:hypothetical protein
MPKQSPAVVRHREVLASTKAAVAKWAHGNTDRDAVASSMLALLADCDNDTNGDQTLDAVSSIFEEHAEVLSDSLAHHLGALANAAHALGRFATRTTTRVEFVIRRVMEQQEEARARFVESCDWLARNLTDAARKAQDGLYVTETVMTSSLVWDIPQRATEYRVLGETLRMLREMQHDAAFRSQEEYDAAHGPDFSGQEAC